MKEITTVGVDLAKDVIVVCAADRSGRPVLVRKFSRQALAEWAATLVPCTFGDVGSQTEICASARTGSVRGRRDLLDASSRSARAPKLSRSSGASTGLLNNSPGTQRNV